MCNEEHMCSLEASVPKGHLTFAHGGRVKDARLHFGGQGRIPRWYRVVKSTRYVLGDEIASLAVARLGHCA